jgi:hypothetical protein
MQDVAGNTDLGGNNKNNNEGDSSPTKGATFLQSAASTPVMVPPSLFVTTSGLSSSSSFDSNYTNLAGAPLSDHESPPSPNNSVTSFASLSSNGATSNNNNSMRACRRSVCHPLAVAVTAVTAVLDSYVVLVAVVVAAAATELALRKHIATTLYLHRWFVAILALSTSAALAVVAFAVQWCVKMRQTWRLRLRAAQAAAAAAAFRAADGSSDGYNGGGDGRGGGGMAPFSSQVPPLATHGPLPWASLCFIGVCDAVYVVAVFLGLGAAPVS